MSSVGGQRGSFAFRCLRWKRARGPAGVSWVKLDDYDETSARLGWASFRYGYTGKKVHAGSFNKLTIRNGLSSAR